MSPSASAEPELLEEVFAAHEMGYVPAGHERFLRSVAETHHLGIVSNLCARPEPWLRLFRRTDLLPLFHVAALLRARPRDAALP